MKKIITSILVLVMILSMSLSLGACKKSSDEEAGAESTEQATEQSGSEDPEETADGEPVADAETVKTFEPDAKDEIGQDLPLQIESVSLLSDGSVVLIPTDDLKVNELGDSEATSLMPFSESGDAKVKDIYLYRIGNGGYRTVVALMDDGTISAINPIALIDDHIIAVKDNLGGRDSFTGVEQEEGEDAFSIVGKTEEGDDVILDPVILTEEEDVQPVE